MSDAFWQALALVLVFEGLLPFISPGRWKTMFSRMLTLPDEQLRLFGLGSVLIGLVLLWVLG